MVLLDKTRGNEGERISNFVIIKLPLILITIVF